MQNVNFNELIDYICKTQNLTTLRTVVTKELLHYDILNALSNAGVLAKLTFQGGTALRLCYKLKRYSEDLDFAGGTDFNQDNFLNIKDILENYIRRKYNLNVTVKDPKHSIVDSSGRTKINVAKWQLSIVTHPEQSNIPQQKIRIEIANVPSYTRKLMPILSNYEFLPDGYEDTFVYVESLEEILADKIIAYAARPYIKNRDIWDLQWLNQQNVTVNTDFVQHKIQDYGINDFRELLLHRISLLKTAVMSNAFTKELSRFLDIETRNKTLEKPGFDEYVIETVTKLLTLAL